MNLSPNTDQESGEVIDVKKTVEEQLKNLQEYEQLLSEFTLLKEAKDSGENFDEDRYFIVKGKMEKDSNIKDLDELYVALPESIPQISLREHNTSEPNGLIKILPEKRGALFKSANFDGEFNYAEMITTSEALEMLERSEKGTQEVIKELNIQLEITKKLKSELES